MALKWFDIGDTTLPDAAPRENATTMPIFPLSANRVHLPYTSPTFLMYEPRYHAMLKDILFSGTRKFMVCNVDKDQSGKRLAEVGAVFYLKNLDGVSKDREKTGDAESYVAKHIVIGRAKLVKVLNPSAALNKDTYLRAEVAELEDSDADTAMTDAEAKVRSVLQDLIDVQIKLNEVPRLHEDVKYNSSFTSEIGRDDKGNLKGLWGTIVLWQRFLETRIKIIKKKMQKEVQDEIVNHLSSKNADVDKLKAKGKLDLDDMPESSANEIRAIRRRYQEKLEAAESYPHGEEFQALLQSGSHAERLAIFLHIINQERKRLAAKATLQAMFKDMNFGDGESFTPAPPA